MKLNEYYYLIAFLSSVSVNGLILRQEVIENDSLQISATKLSIGRQNEGKKINVRFFVHLMLVFFLSLNLTLFLSNWNHYS